MSGSGIRFLCDTNVWLALVIEHHTHHEIAKGWFESLDSPASSIFCRATQISFLRLLTQKIAIDYMPLTNQQAWDIWTQLSRDETIVLLPEPEGIDHTFQRFTSMETSSPRVWMDGYLAAFAVVGNLTFVTFDPGFRRFEAEGLNLLLLNEQ